MDEGIKKGIRRLAEDAEAGIARSILRWKYNKEGAPVPGDDDLNIESRRIVDRARGIISRRGMNILNEFKKVYGKSGGKEDSDK
ncbi:MAG: hypothetical protein QG552_3154 [Thermodesulfobacteriota bacterium]|nr:hypothetical protein [Thermodesulfobacteriota bacterium]